MKKIDLYKNKKIIFLYGNEDYLDFLKFRFSFFYIYNKFFKKSFFLNYKFFLKVNLFYSYGSDLILKHTYLNFLSFYSFVPTFLFEKQFLFKKVDFDLFISQNNFEKISYKYFDVTGLNFLLYNKKFDLKLIKIEQDPVFFYKFFFLNNLGINLSFIFFFLNLNLFILNLIEVYRILIFLNLFNVN